MNIKKNSKYENMQQLDGAARQYIILNRTFTGTQIYFVV